MAVDAYGTRFLLNAFRAVDRLVYALFFVAAVGLGPFPGVLAVVVYTATVLAQLYSGDRGRAAAGAHRAPGPTTCPALRRHHLGHGDCSSWRAFSAAACAASCCVHSSRCRGQIP